MNANELDEVLTALAQILGEYSKVAVIGGGVALYIYRHYVATEQSDSLIDPAITDDFDMLVPRELPKMSDSIADRLHRAGFSSQTHSLETPPVESYIGTLTTHEIAIEFLTDRRQRSGSGKNIRVGGISAQPLSYIEMSRENSISITTKQASELLVVTPAAWMFHKALTFPKRRSVEKRAKDLYGIWYAGTQLASASEAARHDLKELAKQKPSKWKTSAKKNIQEWISQASPDEWRLLEKQDPAGVLSKEQFRRFADEELKFG